MPPADRRTAPALDALRPGCIRAIVLHGWGGPAVVRAARAGSRLRHGLFLPAFEQPGSGALDVGDAAERRAGGEGPRLREHWAGTLRSLVRLRWPLVAVYSAGAAVLLLLAAPGSRRTVSPRGAGQFQLRLRAPTGTRIERTELIALKALDVIQDEAGPENVEITTGLIGVQPASYPINTIYLLTSGPQEAVLKVALKPNAPVRGEALKERLRRRLAHDLPGTAFRSRPAISSGRS